MPEWIYPVLLVLSGIQQGTVGYFNNKRQAKLANMVKDIASAIAADNQLLEQLQEAYQRKDAELVQSLIMSSPFGSRLVNLRRDREKLLNQISDLGDKKKSVAAEQARVNNEITEAQVKANTTGSIIGDLIRGGGSLSNPNKIGEYRGSGYTVNDLKEINYGQKK